MSYSFTHFYANWFFKGLFNDDNVNFSCFRHIWESKADGSFVVAEDTENEPLGRGTEIRLHLREEAGEYLEESKLKVSGFPIWDFLTSDYLVLFQFLLTLVPPFFGF